MYKPAIVFPNKFSFSGFDFPSSSQDKFGGLLRRTYVRDRLIIQISPVATDEMPDEDRRLLAPWLHHEHRIERLEQVSSQAKTHCALVSTDGLWSLDVPRIIKERSGEVRHGAFIFPVVVSQLVRGQPLEDNRWSPVTMEPLTAVDELLKRVVDFLTVLHGTSGEGPGRSLGAFYRQRFRWVVKALQNPKLVNELGSEATEMIQRIFQYVVDNVDAAVLPEEMTSQIHGDFRENNLLVDILNSRCWIIDFDQGVAPGDWASDLWKFGLLQYETGRMSGMLTQPLYDQLRDRYITRSKSDVARLLLTTPGAADLRVELLLFDISFSMLLFRHHQGWNFETREIDGQTVRGTKFIVRLFQKQHDRIVRR